MSVAVAVLVVALLAALVLVLGAYLSLDRSGRYSAAASALPLRTSGDGPGNGLVQLSVGEFAFRARVGNLDGDGDAVILVHGFPQTSVAWEPLADDLEERGFRVVAYDQRGYSPGARPEGGDAYCIDRLVGDVISIADALGFERFHLVGHDWGAAAGWATVMSHPSRILSWTALSIGHSFAFRDAVKNDRDQRRRSLYILLFRWPVIPEWLLAWGRFLVLRKVMYYLMPEAHTREYLAMLAEPGALTAVLNFYRAMGRPGGLSPDPQVSVPTLFVWGNRDPAAGRTAAVGSARYMTGPYRFVELDAGHWLMETRQQELVPLIVEHIDSVRASARG